MNTIPQWICDASNRILGQIESGHRVTFDAVRDIIFDKFKVDQHPELAHVLQPFCDEECSRWSLEAPFVQSKYEYATDGRIAVRRWFGTPDTQGRKVPNDMASYFAGDEFEYFPVPPVEYEGICPSCDGNGSSRCECCDHETPCGRCGGTMHALAWVGRYALSPRFDAMIRRLPDLMVAMDTNKKRIRFRSFDIEGVVMPLGKDEDCTEPQEREFVHGG